MLRVSHLSGFNAYLASTAAVGALALLSGETDGFAIDATSYDTITAASYTGGPVGGTVAVINTGDPTDDLSNVALDASNVSNGSTGPKMMQFPSSPYARWTPHNQVIQSQTFDNAAWGKGNSTISANSTTAPDGTTTADTHIEASDVAQYHDMSCLTALTVISGQVYTGSIYVKAASGSRRLMLVVADTTLGAGGVYAGFDLAGAQVGFGPTTFGTWTSGAAPTITSVGNGWYRCTVTAITAHATLKLQIVLDEGTGTAAVDHNYNGDGTSGLYLWGAQVNRGYTATPHLVTTTAARMGIPQGYDTTASRYGLQIEAAATNLCLYSDDFTNAAWTKSNMTTAKTATGPDAAANSASTLTATAGNATALQAITSASSARISGFWVKRRTGTGNIDLTQDNGTSWTTVTVTSDWTRVELTAATLTNPTVGIRIVTSGDAVDVFGFQHEIGSVLTSTIPTLGSTVTRAVDAVGAATSSYPHSATEGTTVAWLRSLITNNATTVRITTLNDGTNNETIQFAAQTSDSPDSFLCSINDGAANQVDPAITKSGSFSTSGNKAALFYKLNDSGVLVDAGTEVADTSCTMPTVTSMQIGYDSAIAARVPTAFMYQLTYLPRRMTQAQMQAKTA
jgi:hypothetical protein